MPVAAGLATPQGTSHRQFALELTGPRSPAGNRRGGTNALGLESGPRQATGVGRLSEAIRPLDLQPAPAAPGQAPRSPLGRDRPAAAAEVPAGGVPPEP